MATAKNTSKNITKKIITDPQIISGELLEEALKLDLKVEIKQIKSITKESFDEIINEISKEYSITPSLAIAGLFTTLQAGGTNNSKRSNVKITLGETSFESKTINNIILKNCKGITPRQLARYFADQIQVCAIKYNITGNSFIYLNRFHSNLLNVESRDTTEQQWCADFQIDNPNCPEYIRHALRQRYNDKFRKYNTNSNNANK